MKITEVWSNGKDVVIKYHKEDAGVWIAASKWLSNNGDMSSNHLIKNGYHKTNISFLKELGLA